MIRVMKFTSRWAACVAALALSAGCAGSSNGGTTRPLMSLGTFEQAKASLLLNIESRVE